MSDHQQGLDWWRADDGRWYPPEQHPDRQRTAPLLPPPQGAAGGPQWGMASTAPSPRAPGPHAPPTATPGRPPVNMTIEPRRRLPAWAIALIVVLAAPVVLGVIAGVVVFAVGGLQDDAGPSAEQERSCLVELRTLRVAALAFEADVGVPPTFEADLVPTYLVRTSDEYDLVSDGTGSTFVLQPGSVCPPP